jgi:hypothetical protein
VVAERDEGESRLDGSNASGEGRGARAALSRFFEESCVSSNESRERCTSLFMKSPSTQLEFGFVRWGGKRRGAGRKPQGARAGVGHDARATLSGREPVSVTLRFVEGLLSLRGEDTHALLVRAMSAASRGDDFQVCAYSVQTNHVHLPSRRATRASSRAA